VCRQRVDEENTRALEYIQIHNCHSLSWVIKSNSYSGTLKTMLMGAEKMRRV